MPGKRSRFSRVCVFLLGGWVLLGTFATAGDAAIPDWTLVRDREGIQVFTREVSGSPLRAVRAVARVKASATQVVALLRDVPERPSWDATCASAEVIGHDANGAEKVYVHSRLPWPVKDRDMVLRASWSVDAGSKTISMTAQAISGGVDIRPDRVRIVEASNVWYIKSLGESESEIVTEIHLDPGGQLPAWLLNYLSEEAPFDSLHKIRQIVESGRYKSVHGALNPLVTVE